MRVELGSSLDTKLAATAAGVLPAAGKVLLLAVAAAALRGVGRVGRVVAAVTLLLLLVALVLLLRVLVLLVGLRMPGTMVSVTERGLVTRGG